VALGHAFLFPTYTCGFYLYMSALEGKGVEGGWVKFKDTWWEVFVVGSSFWPVANMVNFKYVKPQYRLVYLNVAGLAWNSYLSYQNQRSNVAHPSLEDAETTTTTTTTRARVKRD
jgi:protein Mpv17